MVLAVSLEGRGTARAAGPGRDPGSFDRPNGVAVVDDLVFVVERDNGRVQVLRLPGMESVATFGDDVLVRPYGITLFAAGNHLTADSAGAAYRVFVTDDYGGHGDRGPGAAPFDDAPDGAVYAVHDDGGVAAFPWSEVVAALGLRGSCGAP